MVTLILHAGTNKKKGYELHKGRRMQTDRKLMNHPVGGTTCRVCWVETLLSAVNVVIYRAKPKEARVGRTGIVLSVQERHCRPICAGVSGKERGSQQRELVKTCPKRRSAHALI